MTLAEKLQAVADAKKDIRLAINSKGSFIDITEPFSGYGDKIRAIDQVLSGEGFGAVIGTPSGKYYLRTEVYFYNNYLENPRFYTSSSSLGPYTEVIKLPFIISESTDMYVFASDKEGKNFTSIYRFQWDIRGTSFEDMGVLPDASQLILRGSDDITFEFYPNDELFICPDVGAIERISILNAYDTITIR